MPSGPGEATKNAAAEAADEPPSSEPPQRGAQARDGRGGTQRWKVVETSTVTDESLEAILNEWTGRGWMLDGIRFAMRESSRRPAMAFVCFVREGAPGPGPGGAAQDAPAAARTDTGAAGD